MLSQITCLWFFALIQVSHAQQVRLIEPESASTDGIGSSISMSMGQSAAVLDVKPIVADECSNEDQKSSVYDFLTLVSANELISFVCSHIC